MELSGVYYSKAEIDNMLLSYSTDSYVDYTFYTKAETDNMLLAYRIGSYIDCNFCNKAETGNLLATKVSNIGNVTLPGHLDIGATYTNSRIRCNAELGGYTGYAE